MIRLKRNLFFIGILSFIFLVYGKSENFTKKTMTIEFYEKFYEGVNPLHYYLIDEATRILHVMAAQNWNGNLDGAIIDFVSALILVTQAGDVTTASRILDVCWAILVFNKAAGHYVYPLSGNDPSIIGVMIENIEDLSFDRIPFESHIEIKETDLIEGFILIGYFLGKLVYTTAQYNAIRRLIVMNASSTERMLKKYLINSEAFFMIYEHIKTISKKVINGIESKREEYIGLLHGITQVLPVISQESLPVFLRCVHKGIRSCETGKFEDVSMVCAKEIQSLIISVEKMKKKNIRSVAINQ